MTCKVPAPSAGRQRHVVLLVGVATLAYAAYALPRHWNFGSSGFDLGIFNQAVWHYSRFEVAESTLSGYPNRLAEHFDPILILLVPFYWLFPRPETLLVAQSFLLAVSAAPVYWYAAGRLGRRLAVAATAAYLLNWGLQRAAAFDFHELAFAPVFVAGAILAIDRRRWGWMWCCLVALTLVKEELTLLTMAFGGLLLLRGEIRRGLLAVGLGLSAFVLIVSVIMPSLGGGPYSGGGPYDHLGGSFGAIVLHVLAHPLSTLTELVTPRTKALTIFLYFAPFLFLPLLSVNVLLIAPIVAARLLSSSPLHWGPSFHYSAPLVPILAMSAIDGLAIVSSRLTSPVRRDRAQAIVVGVWVFLCAILPGSLPIWKLFRVDHYRAAAHAAAGYDAISMIPPDASVVAQDALAAHLSSRKLVYTLKPGAPDGDFVIAASSVSPWPNPSAEAVTDLIKQRREAGFTVSTRTRRVDCFET